MRCSDKYAGSGPPASFWRRRARSRSNYVQSHCSGVVFSPEGAPRAESRREPPLRRRFLAGGRVLAAGAYETFAPASFRRRSMRSRSDYVQSRCSGAAFSPEGASRTESRREPPFRRQPRPLPIQIRTRMCDPRMSIHIRSANVYRFIAATVLNPRRRARYRSKRMRKHLLRRRFGLCPS